MPGRVAEHSTLDELDAQPLAEATFEDGVGLLYKYNSLRLVEHRGKTH